MPGTPFQKIVWEEIKKIPAGQTRTYKEIAVSIGNPRASRAVANACAANPNPIKVPCHRVIRSDGSYGGYSGPGGPSGKGVLISTEREIASLEILDKNSE